MRHASRKGFTLVELLTTLTILSVVSAIGVSAFYRVTEYWNRTAVMGTLNSQATLALDSLREDFACVASSRTPGGALEGKHDEYAGDALFWQLRFENDAVTLPVQAWNPIDATPGPVMKVAYFIDRSGPTARLIRQAAPVAPVPAEGGRTVVADMVAGLRLSYFDGARWLPAWDSPRMPRAVRVSMSLLDPRNPDQHLARQAEFNLNVR